jgi:hypothetical protein
MAADRQDTPEFLSKSASGQEPRSFLPWIVAGVVVVLVIGALILLNGHKAPQASPGGAGLATIDPYAANLPISNLKMSESSNFAGGKVTYVDGHIANHGEKTVTGITVQVAFRDFGNQLAQKETLPLAFIRTREPYVDTEQVNANPLKPGDERDFRLILDQVSSEWNGQYPEVRIIQITSK